MPGWQHAAVSLKAYNLLDSRAKHLWEAETDKISYFSHLPDKLFDLNFEHFCALPGGRRALHKSMDRDWDPSISSARYYRSAAKCVMSHYIGKLLESLSEGRMDEFTGFACVLSHYIADHCHPAHILEGPMLYKLLPPPPGKYWHFNSRLFEIPITSDAVKEVSPSLLGTGAEEAAFNALNGYCKARDRVMSRIIPATMAIYDGDEETAEAHTNACYREAVKLISSIWHTVFCIADNRFKKSEKALLEKRKLNNIIPLDAFTAAPYFFYPLFNHDCDGKGNLAPLKLMAGEDQAPEAKEFKDGIAMTFGYLLYEIPASLYKKISVKAGISPLAGKGSEAVFRIIDARTPPLYKDAHNVLVDYGGDILYESKLLTEKDACVDIEAELGKAELITLSVECTGENKNTHAVWADPLLFK